MEKIEKIPLGENEFDFLNEPIFLSKEEEIVINNSPENCRHWIWESIYPELTEYELDPLNNDVKKFFEVNKENIIPVIEAIEQSYLYEIASIEPHKDKPIKLSEEAIEFLEEEKENIKTTLKSFIGECCEQQKWRSLIEFPYPLEAANYYQIDHKPTSMKWDLLIKLIVLSQESHDIQREAQAHYLLGDEYYYHHSYNDFFSRIDRKRFDEVIREYQEALKFDHNNVQVRYALIRTNSLQGTNNHYQALKECLELLKVSPQEATSFSEDPLSYYEIDIAYHLNLIDEDERDNIWREVIQTLQTIVQSDANNFPTKTNLMKLESMRQTNMNNYSSSRGISKQSYQPLKQEKGWAMFQGNYARTGESRDIVIPPLKKMWEFQANGCIQNSPIVSEGLLFFGTANRKAIETFYAVQADTGKVAWEFKTNGMIWCTPTVSNGIVYFGAWDKNFYALDVMNGRKIWEFHNPARGDHPLTGIFNSSPLVIGNVVCLCDEAVYLLDAMTGRLLGQGPMCQYRGSDPAFSNGIIYVGISNSNRLYAFNVDNGESILDIALNGKITAGPVVSNEILYIGTNYRMFYSPPSPTFFQKLAFWKKRKDIQRFTITTIQALDIRNNGQKIWEFFIESKTNSGMESCPAVAQGRVFIGAPDGKIYALDAYNGQKIWAFDTGTNIAYSPVISGTTVYIIAEDGRFYGLDANGGELLWSFDCGKVATRVSPAIYKDMVYVGSDKISAFRR